MNGEVMNRKRCPWCGKIINKYKDTISWQDVISSPSVPRMLRKANCGHCKHKYGQVPIFPHLMKMNILLVLLAVLTFALQSVILLVLLILSVFLDVFLHVTMQYSKLDEKGKPAEENSDLNCEMEILEKYGKLKPYELYFLNNDFDDFEPFVLASPVHVCSVNKKSDTVLGEFLYMNENNYDYIEKDSCELYDTEMNLIGIVKFLNTGTLP